MIRVGTIVRVGFSFAAVSWFEASFFANRAVTLRTLREENEKLWLLGMTSYLKQLALNLSRALLLQKQVGLAPEDATSKANRRHIRVGLPGCRDTCELEGLDSLISHPEDLGLTPASSRSIFFEMCHGLWGLTSGGSGNRESGSGQGFINISTICNVFIGWEHTRLYHA